MLPLLLLILFSCVKTEQPAHTRSIYYWNTTFNIDSVKRDFLDSHRIERIYVRYFDVVPDAGNGFPKPNATIRFDSIPPDLDREIVPVVFILPGALDCDVDSLGNLILSRVKQMSATHGMGPVNELQIDCDWTTSTRHRFFEFMRRLKSRAEANGVTLSVTIRLHQLASTPPPAHKGVLMVYNTGDMRSLEKEKPILDHDDVLPYLKHLKSYPLPLASAYPIYRWELLFRNGEFVDIIHHLDEIPIMPSDSIVVRQPEISDILTCRRAIESVRRECANEIILFDLNNYNINRYDNESFESLYN